VDENGTVHYVDSKSKIPREFLDDLDVYKEKYDHLSDEEKSIVIEKDRKRRKELRKQQLEEKRRKEQIAKEKLLKQQLEEKQAEERRKQQVAREKYLKSLQTKITVEGSRVLVPCTLGYEGNEIKTQLLLDTGASVVVLHRPIAEQLRIKGTKSSKAQVAGGATIRVGVVELNYVEVGPYRKENIYANIISHKGPPVSYNGLLGMNFLRGLDYTIDFESQIIRWKPSASDSGNGIGTEKEGPP
jgi:clan AA aspartic protease (TIGR02281 family)